MRHLDPSEVETGPSPSAVLELQQRKALQANAALIDMCCSNRPGCVHGYIKDVVIANSQRARAIEQFAAEQQPNHITPDLVLNSKISCSQRRAVTRLKALLPGWPGAHGELSLDGQINDPDIFGNTTIFFAARSGAPIWILIDILHHVVDVNALNNDGQTFLFLLDPDNFSQMQCCCDALSTSPHSSAFECLIRRLEARGFDFDHIDHHGRHFLSYLCASTSFNGDWLVDMAEKDPEWKQRLQSLSWVRDSSGSFLQDFARLNTNNEKLAMYTSEQFLPPFMQDPLSHNDGKRRTALHEYIRGQAFLRAPYLLSELIRQNKYRPEYVRENINKYDELGYTPILDFLNRLVAGSFDEEIIVAKTRDLVAFGANINARARDGSTILHIAAKKSCPGLLKYVLSVGVQANCRDEAGLTALDYAARILTRSRTPSAPAILTAMSFKVAGSLLDHASLGMFDTMEWMKKADWVLQRDFKALRAFDLMTGHSGFQTAMEACANNVVCGQPLSHWSDNPL
jgi:hypothetical protein